VLALQETVVGGEEDVGVVELPDCLQLFDERGDHLVDGQHRLQALPVTLVRLGDLFVVEGGNVLDPGRLVRDVFLVEGGWAGRFLIGEGSLVALGRSGGLVRGGWGHVGEEGALLGGCLPHELGGLTREDVGEEVFRFAAIGDDLSVLVYLIIVGIVPFSFYKTPPLVPARRDVGRVLLGRV
jgi:hypothetical protein